MQTEIKNWLNGKRRDSEAIRIIEKYNLLERIPATLNFYSFLKNFITKKIDSEDKILAEKNIISNDKNLANKKEKNINDTAIGLKRYADKLYKEMSNYRAILFDLCPVKRTSFENEVTIVNKRAELAKKVIELQYKIDTAYDKYEYAIIHDKVPETSISENIDFDIYRKITNTRKYISRLKNSKIPLTDKQVKKLDDLQVQLNYLLDKQKKQYDKL